MHNYQLHISLHLSVDLFCTPRYLNLQFVSYKIYRQIMGFSLMEEESGMDFHIFDGRGLGGGGAIVCFSMGCGLGRG